ncbi:MAG: DUF3987 domain-containing protein [Tenuifilaceae bacterium]|nr:DUF3987 domain-containing protein [Tenuifilaceae bacterium]
MDNILDKTRAIENLTQPNGCKLQESEPDKVPPFPLDVFPKTIQDIIIEANKRLSFPTDFLAVSILYSFSVAIGNTYQLEQIKDVWYETCVLWIAIIGDVSVNKSHPLKWAMGPLFEFQEQTRNDFKRSWEQYQNNQVKPNKERDPSIEKPVEIKCLLSDFTQEVIAETHENNLKGLGVWTDELMTWLRNFNRYKKGTGSEEQTWLSIWSKAPLIVDRRGSGSFFVKQPFISVIGTTQTENARELCEGSKKQNGFFERFLIVFPDNLKKQPWSEELFSNSYKSQLNKYIDHYLQKQYIEYDNPNKPPKVIDLDNATLRYSLEAKDIIFKWQLVNTERINKADNYRYKALWGKVETYLVRFCLLLQLIDDVANDKKPFEISEPIAHKAIKLAKYFEKNSLKIIRLEEESTPLDVLPIIQKKWYNKLPSTPFQTSEAVSIAKIFGIAERTCKKHLLKKELFSKINHGLYEKNY